MKQSAGTEAIARVHRMRRSGTQAERLNWNATRSRRLGGFKFRHQAWIGAYIADFVCIDVRLIADLDGSQHGDAAKCNKQRDATLVEAGYRTVRFWDNDVTGNLDGVLEIILRACAERLPSPFHAAAPRGPLPLPRGERSQ